MPVPHIQYRHSKVACVILEQWMNIADHYEIAFHPLKVLIYKGVCVLAKPVKREGDFSFLLF